MRCMSRGRVWFLLFKLCCDCAEVCAKMERKRQKGQGHMPGSVMTRELSSLPGMHWEGAPKRWQLISMFLQARLIKCSKSPWRCSTRLSTWLPKSCLRMIGSSCLIWSVKSLQLLPPYKMLAMMWMVGGTLSKPSVGAWASLNSHSNASHWLMNIQKH